MSSAHTPLYIGGLSVNNGTEIQKPALKRRVLSDDVVEYLIDAIMKGDFPPGSKIVELQVARLLEVSQSTIREALRELETRGFLESKPFRGTFVRKFTLEGLKDYFKTRTELELIAARWAVENDFASMDLVRIERCVQEMGRFVVKEDHVAFRKKDMEFHKTLVEGSGSPSLLSAWSALCHSYWAYFGLYFEQKQYNLADQTGKHAAIFALLSAGRLDELRESIESHYVDISVILGLIK